MRISSWSVGVLFVASVTACKGKTGGTSENKTAETPPAAPAPATVAPTPPPAAAKPPLAELEQASLKSLSDALNAHDAKKYAATFAEHSVAKFFPEVLIGREAIANGLTGLYADVPDFKLAFEKTFTKGNTVVATWTWTGTDAKTKRPVGLQGAGVFEYGDDGLIKELRAYQNDATIESQKDPKAKAGTFRPVPTLPASTDAVASKDPAAEDALVAKLEPMYEALDAKKEADVLAFFTDDTQLDDYTTPKNGKGKKDSKAMYDDYVKTFPDFKQMPLTKQLAVGDYVISEGEIKAPRTGQIGTIKPSTKPVDVHFIDIVEMKDGKIAHLQTFVNAAELLAQLGVH